MKSKAHSKNSTASSGSSSSTQQSVHSSDSDTDDSGMDSSDESTRQQEHEAAYGLLSLSQKPAQSGSGHCDSDLAHLRSSSPNELLMTPEEIAHVSKTNYAKNKILDERNFGFRSKKLNDMHLLSLSEETTETKNVRNFLGTGCVSRPLTYPYTSVFPPEKNVPASPKPSEGESQASDSSVSPEPKSIKQFHVIQRYLSNCQLSPKLSEALPLPPRKTDSYQPSEAVILNNKKNAVPNLNRALPTLKVNDVIITTESVSELRKRKFSSEIVFKNKVQRSDGVMDLSMTTAHDKIVNGVEERILKNVKVAEMQKNVANEIYNTLQKTVPTSPNGFEGNEDKEENFNVKAVEATNNNTTKNETADGCREQASYGPVNKDVNDIIVKSEGDKSCTICAKSFSKPSQLRLHMNIHYLERRFRCESCSVSFRTKGHLQKHERSASHRNKLSSSPALSSSEPRPFKCSDCNIAFRIHGHLAKHLRSKMHIMKLECLAKIPFGLYAELERSNSLLTEINTSDGDQCLESLKVWNISVSQAFTQLIDNLIIGPHVLQKLNFDKLCTMVTNIYVATFRELYSYVKT
nr:MDS1 and EVI1 complex locus protein EVI1-A-like [Leptinotarsa decemlineata]